MYYHRPHSLTELQTLLGELPLQETHLLAGGTDLFPRYEQHKLPFPAHLVDLKHLPELRGIRLEGDGLWLGAGITISELRESELVRELAPPLWQSTHQFAGVQIRNRATLGGNICNASPAGDTLPPLYALKARARLVSPAGERELPLAEFILGPGQTALEPGEILLGIEIPDAAAGFFEKVGLREAMAISVVNLAGAYHIVNGQIKNLVLAAGAVAPTVVTLDECAQAWSAGASMDEVLSLVDRAISPIDDIRASAAYRRLVLKNLVRYHLQQLEERKA